MTWRDVAAITAVVLAGAIAFEAGTLRGERDIVARELAACRPALAQESAAAAASRLRIDEAARDREELMKRLADQAAVVNDLGAQLDRMRAGCPTVKP